MSGMICQPIFKFATIILLLLGFTGCQSSADSSSDTKSGKSALNSEGVSYAERVLQEQRIKEKFPSSTRQKAKGESRDLQSYIGLEHPPLPSELKDNGGFFTGTGDNSEYPYSVDLIQKGNNRMIWLDLLISGDENGRGIFKVMDIVLLPSFDKNSEIVTGGSSDRCSVNGKYEPNLIALAKLEDRNTEYLTKIRKAWRIDPTAGKFKKVSLEKLQIQCQNVNFGI